MTAIRTLFLFGAVFLTLARVNGAPAKYDQRQEGDFNLHAQLENFLFVVVIPSSSGSNNDLFSDLALQALELKQQLSSRSSSPIKQRESIKPAEEVPDEKPYSLEVIRISEDRSDKGSSGNSTWKNEEASSTPSLRSASADLNGAKDTERAAKSVKAFELAKNREMPTILGYFVDTRNVLAESKAEDDSGRIRNVLENVWNPDVDAAKPGTSLKKQLFQKREEDNIAPTSSNVYKSDMNGLIAEKKQQESRLLGDAIENCGPGRRRDAAGICRFDESADSLL